ncbi:hypothetical protein QAD02_001352 [Eretmocerus hayati]|uniref:Uncharacterized protein n=1 Tax=Eretmocerus hayati TaxID=131215 RepID=A0ACC2NGQ6_9HYME|nr:hypothetical protein QAD02_001352 [Eretmocerus hayati]
MFLLQIAAVVGHLSFCYSQDAPKVSTKLGIITGHYKISHAGNKYEAYEGIPFALPPVGERRFEIPEPIGPWTGELVANQIPNKCFELIRDLYPSGNYLNGDEDCLYLKIYSPVKRNGSLPVIVYIYGGAFQQGVSEKNEEHYLIDHDVIYAAMNYRVGILGFLSTGDEVVPGNMGLKDQVLALKWIKENIESFGGDPNRITIIGLSAGAVSVHLHYLSPMSRGLFNSGISLSGTAFKCWAQTDHAREKAMKLGAALDCPTIDTKSLVQCLRKRSAHDITGALPLFMPWQLMPYTPFGPVIEKPSKNSFLTRPPAEIVRSGDVYDVPWITGVVSEEGIYPLSEFVRNETILQDLDSNWEERAPILLDFNYTASKKDHPKIAKRIREHYFGDKPINRENIGILIRLASDRFFNVDSVKAAIAHSKAIHSPVWFYYYSYKTGKDSITINSHIQDYGVPHGEDVYMVIGNDIIIPARDQKNLAMQNLLIQLWTSVAYNSKPKLDLEWSKVDSLPGNLTETNFNYLHIAGPDNLTEEHNIEFIQYSFWKSLGLDDNTQGNTDCELPVDGRFRHEQTIPGCTDRRVRRIVQQNDRHQGFVDENGCFADVEILNAVLRKAKADGGTIGVMDLHKAFDSVHKIEIAVSHDWKRISSGKLAANAGICEKPMFNSFLAGF